MAKSINCYLFILLLASVLFSQSKSSKEAYLVDEFGVLPECDLGARLDPFAMELLSNLDSRGRIIFYKGKNVLPVDYENQWDWATRFTKSYLHNQHGISEDRINISVSGFRDTQIAQLWILPKGADEPKPSNISGKPKLPKNKTFLYAESDWRLPFWDSEPNEILLPQFREEVDADESIREIDSEVENENSKFIIANESYGNLLKKDRSLSGTIIFYADDLRFDVSLVSKRIEKGKERLVDSAGIKSNRINVIYGGFRYDLQAEFWIVSEKDKKPVPTPEEKDENDLRNK